MHMVHRIVILSPNQLTTMTFKSTQIVYVHNYTICTTVWWVYCARPNFCEASADPTVISAIIISVFKSIGVLHWISETTTLEFYKLMEGFTINTFRPRLQ